MLPRRHTGSYSSRLVAATIFLARTHRPPSLSSPALDLNAARIALALNPVSGVIAPDLLYHRHQDGSWSLEGILREALHAPLSISVKYFSTAPIDSPTSRRLLRSLDALAPLEPELTRVFEKISLSLLDQWPTQLRYCAHLARDILESLATTTTAAVAESLDTDLLIELLQRNLEELNSTLDLKDAPLRALLTTRALARLSVR